MQNENEVVCPSAPLLRWWSFGMRAWLAVRLRRLADFIDTAECPMWGR